MPKKEKLKILWRFSLKDCIVHWMMGCPLIIIIIVVSNDTLVFCSSTFKKTIIIYYSDNHNTLEYEGHSSY